MSSQLRSRRAGLTLIELIVVLVVLVGLAGILIPMLPNILGRVHTTAGATNIQEVVKWVQTHEALHNKFPYGWDALVDDAGVGPNYLPHTTLGGHISAAGEPLTLEEANALIAAGIVNLSPMVPVKATAPTGFSATFNPYPDATTTLAVVDGVALRTLTADAKTHLNLAQSGKYILVGFGKRASLVGKTVSEAPVHFSDEADHGPQDFYGRFGLIFKVSDGNTPFSRATFAGAVALHGDGLTTGGEHIEEYYNVVKASQ